MQSNKYRKVKASSLIEVLTALAIIMSGIVIGLLIYNNILSSTKGSQHIAAIVKATQVAVATKQQALYLDQRIEDESMIIEKSILEHTTGVDLRTLVIKVTDKRGKALYQHEEIILLKSQ